MPFLSGSAFFFFRVAGLLVSLSLLSACSDDTATPKDSGTDASIDGAFSDGGDAQPADGASQDAQDSGSSSSFGEQSAFGVFAVFTTEFGDFMANMNQTPETYWQWAADHMENLGAYWTRSNMQLIWDLVEPELGGAFDWSASFGGERCFVAAHQAGVHYLAVFHEGSGGHEEEGKPTLRDPLDNLPAYQRFVKATVERFDGDGVDDSPDGVVIKHWQVGNELDFWVESGRTAAQYVDWVEAVGQAAQEADPEARIALMASTSGKVLQPFHVEAVQGLAQRGVDFDIIDLHHWEGWDMQASRMDAVPQYLQLLEEAGYPDVEIWSCEHGTNVGQPAQQNPECDPPCSGNQICGGIAGCVDPCVDDSTCPPNAPVCDTVNGLCHQAPQTQEQQARSLVYRFVMNRALGVRRILWNNLAAWHCFQEICGHFFDLVGMVADGFGPEETPADAGTKRLSYFSYKMLAQRTDEPVAEQQGRLDLPEAGAFVYEYLHRQSGESGFVAWAGASTTVTLPFSGAEAQITGLITDAAGTPLRSETLAAQDGKIEITLNEDPVWIAKTAVW